MVTALHKILSVIVGNFINDNLVTEINLKLSVSGGMKGSCLFYVCWKQLPLSLLTNTSFC